MTMQDERTGSTAATDVTAAFRRAAQRAEAWLTSAPTRRVPASVSVAEVVRVLGGPLPEGPSDPEAVLDRLADAVEPGLMANDSGRFYGWVMGGAMPAPLAADVLVSAWDQNAGMRDATPGVVGAEEAAGAWLLELLGLPASCGVGFTTGATTANLTGLAAARHRVLLDRGVDDTVAGLAGAPAIRVLVGAEYHGSVAVALRMLGLGAPEIVPADEQGRIDAAALRDALAEHAAPTIVCLQAGNVHSGSFDPFAAAIDAAREADAWVHVDGAFGLWAAATPAFAALTDGMGDADSWATDAHKTLNTPYDGGIAIVRDAAAQQAAMGVHASYLLHGEVPDPLATVPEMSRRARGVPVWAAIAALGRSGVRDLVEGLHRSAAGIAAGVRAVDGAEVLNDVVYTQVCAAFGSDERTRAVYAELLREGAVMPSASIWRGRAVIRFSVSSWRTDAAEVAFTVDAVRRAAERAR